MVPVCHAIGSRLHFIDADLRENILVDWLLNMYNVLRLYGSYLNINVAAETAMSPSRPAWTPLCLAFLPCSGLHEGKCMWYENVPEAITSNSQVSH